jgi:hypothetical protein
VSEDTRKDGNRHFHEKLQRKEEKGDCVSLGVGCKKFHTQGMTNLIRIRGSLDAMVTCQVGPT